MPTPPLPPTSPGRRAEDVPPPTPEQRGASPVNLSQQLELRNQQVDQLTQQNRALKDELARLKNDSADLVELDDQKVLQEVGIYEYHHPLKDAAAYQERLKEIKARIKEIVKDKEAVLASDLFTFNNSLAKGRKMTGDLSKIMLRAYNAEADICLRTLRAGNLKTAETRLAKSASHVEKLGSMMDMRVNPDYHATRVAELELTADYLMKVQEERLAAREEKARLREEKKVQAELDAQREELDKELQHYRNLLETADAAEQDEINDKIASVEDAIEKNDYRAANIRAGYVYVISNRGAFGPNIVKIGLTRRLEPMDRVRELGSASVPFPYDVHALFFSDDAVSLEKDLHTTFADRRVNHINLRREFFFATPSEVKDVLLQKVGNLLEFTEGSEAAEFSQSTKYWPAQP